jgi:hypothetical protein
VPRVRLDRLVSKVSRVLPEFKVPLAVLAAQV